MRKIMLATAMLLAATTNAATAATPTERIEYLFINSPCEAFASLESGARAMMIYNFNEHNGKGSPTNLGTEDARLQSLEPTLITLDTSCKGHAQLKLLCSKRDTLIAVVSTVDTPWPDSNITFFDTRWQQRNAPKGFKAPASATDFLKKGTPKDVVKEVADAAPFIMVELTFSGNKLIAKQRITKQYPDLKKHEKWLLDEAECKIGL